MALGEWRRKVLGEAKGLLNSALGPPIAIDFGVGALKVLQIASGEPHTLVAAASVPTPDGLLTDVPKRLAFQLEALPRLISGVGFKGKRAVCAIPAAQSFCKHMQFQPEGSVTVGALVKSAVPAQLGCDASSLVFRHIEVGPVGRGKGTEVICLAAHRDLVDRFMRGLKEAKLEPVGMHMEYTAALRAFDSITRRVEDNSLTSLYLDVGAGMTKVMIAHGRDLVFCRSIDLGGRRLDAVVAKQLKLELSEARAHRLQMNELVRKAAPVTAGAAAENSSSGLALLAAGMRAGGGTQVAEDRRQGQLPPGLTSELTRRSRMPMAPVAADLTEPLEILTDEISMCLRYYESIFPDRRVDRAIFFGGEARHLGLCQHIARTLKLPAQVADPMAGIARTGSEPTPGVDFRHPQPGWAMTLGLCLSPTDL
jgi:type IV pilus assembly protein PilM